MTSRRFDGRRALVTGASRGIGAGIAERLAAEGADVVIAARTLDHHPRLAGSLVETAARIEARGGRAEPIVVDLSDADDRARLVPAAIDALGGPLDILVNNAAASIYGTLAELSLKRRRLLFEMNVHAPLDLIQSALPGMREAGEAWIVNVSSRSAQPVPGPPFEAGFTGSTITSYGASKAALNRVTNGLGVELEDAGIRANTIEPRAAVLSEGAEAMVGGSLRPDQIEPLEAMVEAVIALCDCPVDVTGQTFVSLDLIKAWGLEVRNLDGSALAEPAQTDGGRSSG